MHGKGSITVEPAKRETKAMRETRRLLERIFDSEDDDVILHLERQVKLLIELLDRRR